MSIEEISNLSASLAESHASTQKLLDKIDLELQIYSDPVWKARDVIWHIAVWDRQVTQSIKAFQNGGKYSIPDHDENKFNAITVKEGRELPVEQVLKGSNQARQEFQRVVERFSPDQLDAELLYPWGDESGDIVQLVNYMLEHDEEHRQEIAAASNQ
jgi:hypothetical protein